MRTFYAPRTQDAPLQPATLPNPLAVKPIGTGAFPTGAAVAVGLAITVGGGIAGGLIAAKVSDKHKVGATIAGTLLGTVIVPMIVSPILLAFAAPSPAVPAPNAGG